MSSQVDTEEIELQITLRKDGRLATYSAVGRSKEEFVALLRDMADKFESGEVRRVE